MKRVHARTLAASVTAVTLIFGAVPSASASTSPPRVIATWPTGRQPEAIALIPGRNELLVANASSMSLSRLNAKTGLGTGSISFPTGPFGLAVAPDGTQAYAVSGDDDAVSIVNLSTNSVAATVAVGDYPDAVARSPVSSMVYAANYTDGTVTGTVTAIDVSVPAAVATIPVGQGPSGIAVTPNGRFVVVADSNSNTASIIDSATNAVVRTLPVGNVPLSVAINPAGTRGYVTNRDSNSVSVIDLRHLAVARSIRVGRAPTGVAFAPDGTRAYVLNRDDNTVSAIDVARSSVLATGRVGHFPIDVAVSSTGRRVFVADEADNAVSEVSVTGTLPCIVPAVQEGVSLATFMRRLRAASCRLGRVTRVRTRAHPRGSVIRVVPHAATVLPHAAHVRVEVAAGR